MRAALALTFALGALSAPVTAQYSVIEDLAGDVYERVGICNGRLQSTANEVDIRAKRLTSFLGSAEALYSSQYNKVLVEGAFFDEGGKIKDLDELADGQAYYIAFNVVSTMYHELGHAEYDVFIEENETPEDATFYKIIKDDIVPWIDEKESGIDKPWLAVQEWHGYFRGKLVNTMLTDWNDLLWRHGFSPKDPKTINDFMVRNAMKKGQVGPSEFGRFTTGVLGEHGQKSAQRSYLNRIRGYSFEVTNGLIDGSFQVSTHRWRRDRGFKDAWWQAMWDHTKHFYCLHEDMASLIQRMEGNYRTELLALKKVQERIWAELVAAGEVEDVLPTPEPPATTQQSAADLLGVNQR